MTLTLHSNGDRNQVVTTEEAQEILARWETERLVDDAASSSSSFVTRLDLSCRVWGPDVLEVLRPFLVQHVVPNIEILKIDDVIATLETSVGRASLSFYAQVFGDAPHLHTVHLDDNALGSRGIEDLAPILQKESLKKITFYNCGLSQEVAETLASTLDAAPHITHIALGRNQMGVGGAKVVGEQLLPIMGQLKELNYNGSRPQVEGTAYICSGLVLLTAEHPHLVKLNLHDCTLNDGENDEDPIHALSTVLERCGDLQELNLEDCELKVDGIRRLVEALGKSKPKLKVLNLGGNELEQDGAEILAEYLTENQKDTLEELYLMTNEFEFEGLEHLMTFFRVATKLRVLDLSANLLEEDSAELLVENRMASLQKLIVTDNELRVDLVRQLRTMYETVVADDDENLAEAPDKEEEEDETVDELAGALENADINA